MARPTGIEPVTYGLAYPLQLSLPKRLFTYDRFVWSLDYIFTIAGGARIVSTDPRLYCWTGFPRYCHRRDALRFHRYSALHFAGSWFPTKAPNGDRTNDCSVADRRSKAVALSD